MKLTIHAGTLAEGLAMTLPCASKDAHLPTLMTAAMHIREDGSVTLVTTNRHLLAEYVIPSEHIDGDTTPGTLLIPAATAAEWGKLAKRETKAHPHDPVVTLTVESDGLDGRHSATLADDEGSQTGRLVDGEHVRQYEKLIPEPDDESGQVPFAGFDPEYLMTIGKISKAAGKNRPVRFDFAGANKATLFRVADVGAFRGAIMPVRVGDWA